MSTSKIKKSYTAKIDNKIVKFSTKIVTGSKLLEAAGYENPQCHTLYQKFRGCDFEKINLDEKVDLSRRGIERFTVKDPEVFHYQFDGEPETTDKPELTATQLLVLGGIKDPENYYLQEFTNTGNENKYSGNDIIKMLCPGSRFVSVCEGPTVVAFSKV